MSYRTELTDFTAVFPFRPWVRRAGLSIVLTALAVTAAVVFALLTVPNARFGWIGEKFVWVYLGTLWIGGAKVWLGTMRPVAEVDQATITLRPLHNLRQRVIAWSNVLGTEQMVGGDRLMVFHETRRGMRSVALNLNLVKGRREFLNLLDSRLAEMGFIEKIVERSRYRSKPSSS